MLANNIFCRTFAASGTYVTATKGGFADPSYRRRMIYAASVVVRRFSSCVRSDSNDPLAGSTCCGTRRSEEMVTRRPRCDGLVTSSLKASRSS